METAHRDDRRRTLWLALISALLILATAQLDEHKRFRRAQDAHLRLIAQRTLEATAQLEQMNEFLRQQSEGATNLPPPPPPHIPHKVPPAPRAQDYMFIARIRQAVCIAAFAVAAAMPVVWAMSTHEFAQRNRRLIADATLALALFATIGMMLGVGHVSNWKNFSIGTNAAGYGLVLVPLGVVCVVLAARIDSTSSGGGGSKM